MPKSIAIANNDVAQIVWRYENKIDNCLGFAVYRTEAGSTEWIPLPAWVGFEGETNPAWQPKTTEVWPIQKFEWQDLTARPGKNYAYRIVPLLGEPGNLKPLTEQAIETETVSLTPERGAFKTYFNRGILSTQYIAHALPPDKNGAPDYAVLKQRIDQPGSPLRNALAGQIIEGVDLLLKRAENQGGSCYAALYELDDTELLQQLLSAKALHLILSNTGKDDATNQAARQDLHAQSGIEIIDRFVPSGHIGHNKFCVYLDSENNPQAVLSGSTNWTDTGLCTQSNNALIVENPDLAKAYFNYWQRLKDDTLEHDSKQGAALRAANSQPGVADLPIDDGKVSVWFAPNTPHVRSSHPAGAEAVPPDLQQVFALMSQAKQAILFLEFEPGKPSVVDYAAECLNQNPKLFVRGAVTATNAAEDFTTTLTHRGNEDPAVVVTASAIKDQFAFWQQELLKGPTAHAIIHDKIVVIDPMSADDCVVITGSHNHGYRASYNNDENLLIIKGHQALARAYTVHVIDIYNHYRFRYLIQNAGDKAFNGLKNDDSWQDKYYTAGQLVAKDNALWFPTL